MKEVNQASEVESVAAGVVAGGVEELAEVMKASVAEAAMMANRKE